MDNSAIMYGYASQSDLNNRAERRMASIDQFYLVNVSNKPFNDYFAGPAVVCLTEVVHPDDKAELTAFVDSYDGGYVSRIFRFLAKDGNYHYNLLKLLSTYDGQIRNINIEMIDLDIITEVNDSLKDDISKFKIMLGLTNEFTFTYSSSTRVITIYRYDSDIREVIYKDDIDTWQNYMISEGLVAGSDKDKFITFVGEIKEFVQTISVKLNSSLRTHNRAMETLRFLASVYQKHNGEKLIIGRIILDENARGNKNVTRIMDELTYDSLTHVYNKKSITDYAVKLVKEEKNNRVTIVVLDVDHFKQVNDLYGHMCGDKVLARVGKKLKEIVGEDGVVGRIGGDEFIVVLNGINDEYVLRGVLRAIRTQIKWEFVNDFDNLMVTCSIGAAFSPDNGTDYETLFKKADYCLYIAKEKGRDRYVFFRDELHKQSYEDSFNKKNNAVNNGREMKELRYLADIMSKFPTDRRLAVKSMLEHMYDAYKLDSINIFYGSDMARVYNYGVNLYNCDDASYVYTEGFTKLLDGKDYAAVGFVGHQINVAPEFCDVMRSRRVFSTIHCVIKSKDGIAGILTLDKCKESQQWAEYEVECAAITATLISAMVIDGENT
ncbi:MAG: GGDEF domain-containing protein [Lachnospira sp.]